MEDSTKNSHNLEDTANTKPSDELGLTFWHKSKLKFANPNNTLLGQKVNEYNTSEGVIGRVDLEDPVPTMVDFFQFDKDFWGVAVKMLVLLVGWMALSSSSCLLIIWAMANHIIVLPVLQMLFTIVGVSLIGVILATAGYLIIMIVIKAIRRGKCS